MPAAARRLRRAIPHDLLVGEVREVLERQAATVRTGRVKQLPIETDILKYRVTERDSPRRIPAAAGHPAEGIRSVRDRVGRQERPHRERRDRKSTRLNSSHLVISYAVFCLKKKK